MRIAQLAPPFETVPPANYGGTERVVATLTEALVERGHDVTLFASEDSRTSARLRPIVPRALWHVDPPSNDFGRVQSSVYGAILGEIDEFDVVHSHLDVHGFPLADSRERSVVTTLHGRLDLPSLMPIYRAFQTLPLVSISTAQRRPLATANWLATVHHGIDLSAFTFNPRPGSYLAFLGRISPDKGLDVAIRVARRTGIPLVIAARPPLPFLNDPEVQRDRAYYEQVIKPMLREPGIDLIGEVGGRGKDIFLGDAAALVFPIRWPEPFGLVMPEAFACGTPVVALGEGSVPEIVEHGVTGFIGSTEDDLVRGVEHLGAIDRAHCRAVAEERFSPHAMAERYEQVFDALLSGVRRAPVYV